MTELARRLGYAADAKLLIVAANTLGVSHAANSGVYDALRTGAASTASLMVPCPWARGAAADYRGEDVGVHLTVNAEYARYRWGPITQAPSLLDGDGGFPRTIEDLWEHADVAEVRRECRAQIERAMQWGVDVTHVGSHQSTLHLRPEFFDVCLELAVEFALPLRLPPSAVEELSQFPLRRLAHDEGVVAPDHVLWVGGPNSRQQLLAALDGLQPGVTEISLDPARQSEELAAYADDAAGAAEAHRLLTADPEIRERLAALTLIGYRPLRDLQRAALGLRSAS
ncbi:MAG: ChbG/HpnK family deacetylase [Acidimicrobiales bacterium]